MAITVTTEPADQHAAYTFVEFKCTTTRNDALIETSSYVSESTLIGSGLVKFIMSVGTSFEVNDIVIGSGFSDSRLNRNHKVLLSNGNNVEVDTAFDSDYSGDSGTLTKSNDNIQLRGDLYHIADTGQTFTTTASTTEGTTFVGIGDTSEFKVGKVARVKGSIAAYDGAHTVIKVSASAVDLDVTFTLVSSGSIDPSSFIAARRIATPTAGVFTFNFASMLQSILSFNVASLASTGITNTSPLSVKDYAIIFTEEYDGDDGLQFESSAQISDEHEAHNIARQVDEVVAIDEFLMVNITKRFLTNQPPAIKIGDTEKAQLHFIVNPQVDDVQFQVKKFDSSDVQIGSNFVSSGFTLVNKRGIISVESSLWDAATAYIEVRLHTDPGGAVLGQPQRYDIDRRCYREPVRFHWLNRVGGFDSYTFTADYNEAINTESRLFEAVRTSASTLEQGGVGTFNVKADKSFSIFSAILNEADRVWLEELVSSPVIYFESGTDLIPIVLTTAQQIVKSPELIQFKLEYVKSNSLVIQHG